MNPTNNDNQVPAMELPGVPPESKDSATENTESAANTEQSATIALEKGTTQQPVQQPQAYDPTTDLGPQPAVATSFDQGQAAPPTGAQAQHQMPAIADDNDLIEKEWVDKAKHIVNQTKDDPHAQNKEMNKMKASYLKKRYNKEVKLVEE